jgi:hypothetical protein
MQLSRPALFALLAGAAALVAPHLVPVLSSHHDLAEVLTGLLQIVQALLPSLIAKTVKE